VWNASVESGSWFESSGSKSGAVVCSNCKAFRCASGATNGELPPFMFRPVKEEDQSAVSAADCHSFIVDKWPPLVIHYTVADQVLHSPLDGDDVSTTNFNRRFFSFSAATIWNELPATIIESNTLDTFKH